MNQKGETLEKLEEYIGHEFSAGMVVLYSDRNQLQSPLNGHSLASLERTKQEVTQRPVLLALSWDWKL